MPLSTCSLYGLNGSQKRRKTGYGANVSVQLASKSICYLCLPLRWGGRAVIHAEESELLAIPAEAEGTALKVTTPNLGPQEFAQVKSRSCY